MLDFTSFQSIALAVSWSHFQQHPCPTSRWWKLKSFKIAQAAVVELVLQQYFLSWIYCPFICSPTKGADPLLLLP